jgi:hypothetical protein
MVSVRYPVKLVLPIVKNRFAVIVSVERQCAMEKGKYSNPKSRIKRLF